MKLLYLLTFLAVVLVINAKQLPTGTYKVRVVDTVNYWDYFRGDLYLFDNNDDIFQRFIFTRLSNGYYTINTPDNNLNVVAKKSSDPEETLSLVPPNSNDQNQQFSLVPRKDGAYRITPRKICDKAIEAPQVLFIEQIFLGTIKCHCDLQHFVFEPVTDGGVELSAEESIARRTASP